MTDAVQAITLSAAFLAGAAGSAHCVAMCGGLAGALGMRSRASGGRGAAMRDALMYHVGRLTGYAAGGALFGALGTTLATTLNLPMLATVARIAAGLLLILAAVKILSRWNALAPIERWGARYWRLLQPLARRAASRPGVSRSFLLGLMWGWLPCGLVYSMLLFAALNGDPWHGSAIMVAFGLGTLPSMLTSSAFASQLSHATRQRGLRHLSGALLLVFGIWMAWAALPSPHHVHG